MARVVFDISISLDGCVAGPNASLEEPLGEGGERLHDWVLATRSWRASHGREGGETGPDDEVVAEHVGRGGATIMGRRMFSGGAGPWERDPKAGGWWGDDPPFRHPVFVLTHHPREPLALGETTFTFVTDGIEPALEQARAAAGERDVAIAGGAEAGRQYLGAGLVDELQLHVTPVLLGAGVRLFDGIEPGRVGLEQERVVAGAAVTHLSYRVAR